MSTPRTDEVETANKFPASKEYYEMVVHARALEAELTAAKERLRSEAMDDYASIKDLQRELAAEQARLDWVFRNCKVTADDFTTGNHDVYAIHDREDLGAAMKEDAK
jgi:hypothetical protein